MAQWWEHSPPTNVARVRTPGVDAICGLSLLLVLFLAPRGFSPGTPVFPSPQKPTLPNSNSIWNARTRLNEFIRTPKCFVGKKVIYIFFSWVINFFCSFGILAPFFHVTSCPTPKASILIDLPQVAPLYCPSYQVVMRRGEEEGSPSSSKGSASLTQPMRDSVQIIRDHQVGTSKLFQKAFCII